MQKGISLFFFSVFSFPFLYRAKINGSTKYHIRDGKICSINKEESIPLTDEQQRRAEIYVYSHSVIEGKEKLKAILGRQFY